MVEVYPSTVRTLQTEILRDDGLLSSFPLGTSRMERLVKIIVHFNFARLSATASMTLSYKIGIVLEAAACVPSETPVGPISQEPTLPNQFRREGWMRTAGRTCPSCYAERPLPSKFSVAVGA
jgi:hypothetical protein